MCSIIAFWFVLFVKIPACHPVKDIALYPNLFNNILNFEIDTCSPLLNRTSNSLEFGVLSSSHASCNNWSVFLPWAETTTTMLYPSSYSVAILFATKFIFSLSATEVPPNFKTIVFIISTLYIKNLVYIIM